MKTNEILEKNESISDFNLSDDEMIILNGGSSAADMAGDFCGLGCNGSDGKACGLGCSTESSTTDPS